MKPRDMRAIVVASNRHDWSLEYEPDVNYLRIDFPGGGTAVLRFEEIVKQFGIDLDRVAEMLGREKK